MPSGKLQDFSVLVVDDEPVIQNLVKGVLNSLGFTNIMIAGSGRKAQELISKNKFDFIVTDWRMDDLDGLDIIQFVRRSNKDPLRSTPIIMLTANTEASYVKTAINAGVDSYLIKPFSAEQLAKRIRALIEHPREFIVSKNYIGPRHGDEDPRAGKDSPKGGKKPA